MPQRVPVVLEGIICGGYFQFVRQQSNLISRQGPVGLVLEPPPLLALFLMFPPGSLKLNIINPKPGLLSHQGCQVERKAVCGVQLKRSRGAPWELIFPGGLCGLEGAFKFPQPAIQRTGELFLLLLDHLLDGLLLALQFRKGRAEVGNNDVDQLGEPNLLGGLQILTTVTDSTTQNTTKDVSPTLVGRKSTVSNGNRERADMISHDSVCHVNTVRVLFSHLSGVRTEAWNHFLNLLKNGAENIRVVVAAHVLENGDQSLETHSGVNGPEREFGQASVVIPVVLHEHKVPDLKYVRIVGVHQRGGISAPDSVEVDL
mmetsp:Transcript_48034/g.94876  ORF Transcript_48034/g.94876 Transcript_48034/m.94876 type:complete len:315 (-) Transcript_48034:706-1650(-)